LGESRDELPDFHEYFYAKKKPELLPAFLLPFGLIIG